MLLPGCRCVNTFGMKFQIRVAFLDSLGRVRSVRVAKPGRLFLDLGASSAFECGVDAQLEAGQSLVRVEPE